MKFEELAKAVAETLKDMMREEGFETFEEMRRCYLWEGNDIREEICYRVKECGGDCFDDMTDITIGWDIMAYGAFKKLVMAHLK